MYNYAIYATFSRRWILFNRIFISDIIVVNDGLWFCATHVHCQSEKDEAVASFESSSR